MTTDTLAEAWRSFEAKVFAQHASPEFRENIRKAFYCGASWMIIRMMEIGDDAASEEEGLEAIGNLKQECDQFTESVLEGEA